MGMDDGTGSAAGYDGGSINFLLEDSLEEAGDHYPGDSIGVLQDEGVRGGRVELGVEGEGTRPGELRRVEAHSWMEGQEGDLELDEGGEAPGMHLVDLHTGFVSFS